MTVIAREVHKMLGFFADENPLVLQSKAAIPETVIEVFQDIQSAGATREADHLCNQGHPGPHVAHRRQNIPVDIELRHPQEGRQHAYFRGWNDLAHKIRSLVIGAATAIAGMSWVNLSFCERPWSEASTALSLNK